MFVIAPWRLSPQMARASAGFTQKPTCCPANLQRRFQPWKNRNNLAKIATSKNIGLLERWDAVTSRNVKDR
jgi:hypothetical protein